eukprot:TRINITY_DN1410_c0_g1_i1.p1 TRINITY_DN1410_c0_g1~~TRINITY_DN1410_c0_g1_i1.p1  ORF type:complete len:150 (+),score=28.96 TRINITY_DN1410_c0_g1_i1:88-537(+)
MDILGDCAWDIAKPVLETAWERIQEAPNLDSDLHKELVELQSQFRFVEALLREEDKDICEKPSAAVKEWLQKLQFAAMDAEDIVELCSAYSASGPYGAEIKAADCSDVFAYLSSLWSKWKFMKETRRELETLKQKLRTLERQKPGEKED